MTLPGPCELLSTLVSIPSPSGEEGPLAELVVDLAAGAGLDAERVGDSAVVRVGSGGPRLLLTSHLDTVPVGEGWSGDPLDGSWRAGRLTARGACDAKVSAAAMLTATTRLAAAGGWPGELLLSLNACEERDGSGMADVLEHLGAPDLAVVGEPTGLRVVRAQSGLAVLIAEWGGRSCHVAHVAHVAHENALVRAAGDLTRLGPFTRLPRAHPLLGSTTIVASQLASGERHNVVPDRAEAVLDARLAPPDDAHACIEHLRTVLPGATVRVRSERLRAVDTPADHPLVHAALRVTGAPEAIGSRTLSDMALLGDVPVIKCGPGETERSHTPNEWVTEKELLAGCAFYEALVPAALGSLEVVGGRT